MFAGRGSPRLIASCETSSVVKVRLVVPRPLEVQAGQYINLWIPSLSWWSWMRTHPFVVISYSPEKQGSLDMLLEPQNVVCKSILRRAQSRKLDTISLPAFFTGPHGVTEPADRYETVLVVASGFGITSVIPYMKKIIHGYNTSTSQTRRLHLVWQAESLGGCTAVIA
jgi:NAD(P)H-flavin reductase